MPDERSRMSSELFVSSVEGLIRGILTDQRHVWDEQSEMAGEVFDVISTLAMSPGKRIRPQCVDLGWRAAGGLGGDMVPARIGAAIELLHVSALLHDDVIDDAATRRGEITAHRRADEIHRTRGWAGESRRYGEGVAILAGDVALALADIVLGEINADTREQWRAVQIDVSMGQFLDHVATARRIRSGGVSDVIVRLKTAQYTVVRPLLLGAHAASPARARELEPVLTSYGHAIGRAFQLHDDILGVFGNSAVTGKPVGDDLREGKPTVLLARAMEQANPDQQRVLDGVGQRELTDADIVAITAVIEATGAREQVEAEIAHLTATAMDAVRTSPIDSGVAQEFVDLATMLMHRDS